MGPKGGESTGMNKRVLVVEDETAAWKELSQALDRASYSLEWTQTGHEALRRSLDDKPFDVVVLDVKLSDMNGWKTLDWFHRLHPFLAVVVLITGADEEEPAGLLGASACLMKPVDGRMLLKTIERLLAEPRQHRVSRSMDTISNTIHVLKTHPASSA